MRIVGCLLGLSLWPMAAWGDLHFTLTQGTLAPLPLTLITDFDDTPFLPALSSVVSDDLERTGVFTWKPGGEKVEMHWDGALQILALGKKWTQPVDALHWRSQAHAISDRLYAVFTGKTSMFGSHLAYVLSHEGTYRVEVADSDGENAHTLLKSNDPVVSLRFSPDGKTLAYVSLENHRNQLFLHDIASGKREMIAGFDGLNNAPAFSPDGKTLALVLTKAGSVDIYRYDLSSRSLEALTHDVYLNTEPQFSPDGRFLYFTSNRGGSPEIYRMNAQKGVSDRQIERITFEGSYNTTPSPTTDGYLVYLHRGRGYQIAVMDLSTKQVSYLPTSGYTESLSVSVDDQWILYADHEKTPTQLGLVSRDGMVQYQLPSDRGSVAHPAWSP